ncbi:MAG: hypothetical protein ACO1OB_24645 [Archangium sp.]
MPSRCALLLVVVSSFAFAGNKVVGSGCESSNECKTIRCVAHRCAPTSNYPQQEGSICEINGHCLSHNCANKRCGPKVKAASTTSTPSRKPAAKKAVAQQQDEEEEVEEAPPLPARTPCTDDLIASGVYADVKEPDTQLRYASSACHAGRPDELARAKELFLAGYGRNFGVTLRVMKASTAEQLACAKKEYDKRKDAKSKRDLDVPLICRESSEVQRCTEDLQAKVFKDEKSDRAKNVCKERSAEVIARALELFNDGYAPTNFEQLCAAVETVTEDQLECMRREYDLRTNNKANYESFLLYPVCERDVPTTDCYFEFLDAFYADEQYTDSRLRSTIESYCRDEPKPDMALLKKIRDAGFTQAPYEWISPTRKLTPAQKSCVEKWLKKAADKEKTTRGFYPPKECSK